MLLEIRTVSRKTPADGRLEITPESARRLSPFAAHLTVRVGDDEVTRGEVQLTAMSCTCDKGGGGAGGAGGAGHEHHFLASDLFRALSPGETVVIELVARGEIHVARPHPL